MSHYKSNVRDQVFNLFEVFGLEKTLGEGPFSDLDVETATEMLGELARLSEGPIAESFVEGDRNPPVFDPATHTVTLPESFKASVRAFIDGGWDKVGLIEELGGVPAPKALLWALHEHVLGANPAVWMYGGGAGFAQILHHLGTEEQKKWAVLAAERGWGSTMVLTEPDAGSDVGAGRTKAVKQEDGSWHIDGVKRFITSADADDLFENTLHLVLARPDGAGNQRGAARQHRTDDAHGRTDGNTPAGLAPDARLDLIPLLAQQADGAQLHVVVGLVPHLEPFDCRLCGLFDAEKCNHHMVVLIDRLVGL